MIKLMLTAAAVAGLSGCAATTPLLVAGTGAQQVAMHDENIKLRAAAALREEPDLLTYSVQAISQGRTEEAVDTYMKGYTSPDYSANMKSLALYQIALLYMNRYNDQRDDQRARQYLQRHRIEFPQSRLSEKIDQRLALLDNRASEPVQLSARQLLKDVDRNELLGNPRQPYDAELTPMSERAITEGRTDDAEAVYLILYDNKASSDEMRAKALYQLGLIFMSPYNQQGNNQKALGYLRKISNEFPATSVAPAANRRINELLNRQP